MFLLYKICSYYKHIVVYSKDYLNILTDGEVNNFVFINFGKYFKSTKGKFYCKLNKKPDLTKVVESLYNFLTTPDEL